MDIKDLRRRQEWLRELLAMGRTGRRRRGIKIPRYQIELELGRVDYVLRMSDTSTPGNRDPHDTSTRDAN